jgi:RNA polymerase sigma-70 factor (ECF subfamily)
VFFVRTFARSSFTEYDVVLSGSDRSLLQRCLNHQPNSWEKFVDRYLGLVVHVVNHTAQVRSLVLAPQDKEDLCSEVFLALLKDDLAILRAFRGECSLATYLTVVARRIVVRQLAKQQGQTRLRQAVDSMDEYPQGTGPTVAGSMESRIQDQDQVQRLLEGLDDRDAQVIRMFHLEGRSYEEISSHTGISENSIGPTLSRARARMKQSGSRD